MMPKSKFKVGDRVQLIADHINASGHVNKKGEKGVITHKSWGIGTRKWEYFVEIDGEPFWGAHYVVENSLRRIK
jgi:hypothetical protein